MTELFERSVSTQKALPIERFFDRDTIAQYQIAEVVFLLAVKPVPGKIEQSVFGRIRMEEIIVVSVRMDALPERTSYGKLLAQIHKKIKYPCVVFFRYENKYKISAWKFFEGVYQTECNILKSAYVSSWIREPPSSEETRKCIQEVTRLLLEGEGSIEDIYNRICQAILYCQPKFVTSKKHMESLLYDLSGKKHDPFLEKIDTTKHHPVFNPQDKHRKKTYSMGYTYYYEYEDVWHALMSDDTFRRIITGRRYENMEQLVYYIDNKYFG